MEEQYIMVHLMGLALVQEAILDYVTIAIRMVVAFLILLIHMRVKHILHSLEVMIPVSQ